MLRLRKLDGSVLEITKNEPFVEICDQEGNIAAVFYCNDVGTKITKITAGTPEAARYSKLFKDIKFCKQVREYGS